MSHYIMSSRTGDPGGDYRSRRFDSRTRKLRGQFSLQAQPRHSICIPSSNDH